MVDHSQSRERYEDIFALKHQADTTAATVMLNAFAGVSVRSFDVTLTDIEGKKQRYEPNRSLDELRRTIGKRLEAAAGVRSNLIIRPRPVGLALIQLDDLDQAKADRLAPHAFLVFRTSPGNFQAWIAVKDPPAGFALRLKRGVGADPTASAATRIAGSLNFKTKYAPSFPLVMITHTNTGKTATARELDQAGFVASIEVSPPPRVPRETRPAKTGAGRQWPDYEQTLRGAPLKNDGSGPDRSRADFMWCKWAVERGWGIEETAARLVEVSIKAQERIRVKEDAGYPLLTARNAATAVERERGRRPAAKSLRLS
jgi:hypothetical protein